VAMALLAAAAWMESSARAEAPSVLKNVPADSHVIVVIKSMDRVQECVAAVTAKVGITAKIDDLAELLAKEKGRDLTQLDRGKAVVIVIPVVPVEDNAKVAAAILLPVKDYEAFLKDNKAEKKGDEQILTGSAGQPLIVRKVGDYAVLADTAEIASQITNINMHRPLMSLADRLSAQQQKLVTEGDAYVHLNVAPLYAALKPKLLKELAAGGEATAIRPVLDLLQIIGDQTESLDLAVTVPADGIEILGLLTAKEDSAMAEAMKSLPKPGPSLVSNVPMGNYLVAMGGVAGCDPAGKFMQQMAGLTKQMVGKSIHDVELAGKLVDLRMAVDKQIRTFSMSLTAGSTEGKVALPIVITVVAELADAEAANKAVNEYLTALTQIKFPVAGGEPAAAIKRDLVKVEGLQVNGVDTVTIDLKAILPAEMKQIAPIIAKAFGEDVLTARIAFRGKYMVATIGGGMDAVAAAFKAIDAKVTGDADAGIAKVKNHLADSVSGVLYLRADRIANVVLGVASALAGEKLPEFGKVEEPVTVSAGVKDRAVAIRMFIPNSLLKEGYSFVMQAMLMPRDTTTPPAAPGKTPSP
jgi:hypothetical protein